MKSILIIGASNAGKSTTAREVCKRLKPTKVYKLKADKNDLIQSQINISTVDNIFNDTFIIEVKNKLILVVSGAPTEQNIKITILIKICIEIGIDISFALVFMRSFEKRNGFSTQNELEKLSEIIYTEKIYRINGDFENSEEWNKRVNKIVELINDNI
jgi:adenylate kinase family enzyme